MPTIPPKALSYGTFSKVLRGYSTDEVDTYLKVILENYTALYQDNLALQMQLAETAARLEAATSEENKIQCTLQEATDLRKSIIEEAYIKADETIAAIRAECEAVLRSFREKLNTEQENLRRAKEAVIAYKQELFEKYRVHIELIEQLAPTYDYEEALSSDEYVEQVIMALKEQLAEQYGVPNECENKACATLSD